MKADNYDEAVSCGIVEKSNHAPKAKVEKPAFSAKFVEDMKAIRLASVQCALLDKPEYLLSLFAFDTSRASGHYNGMFGFGYGAIDRNVPEIDDQFELDTRLLRTDSEEQFSSIKPGKTHEQFAQFQDMGKKVRNGEITVFLARAFKTQKAEFMAEIEEATGANIRSVWTPSATNCFKRLKGAQLDALYMSLLDLKADSDAQKAFSKEKKGDKNDIMHKLFNSAAYQSALNITADQKERIDAWFPKCF